MRPSIRTIEVIRLLPEGRQATSDEVAVEEPLEIRIAGDTISVTMRTPGHDRELALGFLWAEAIITALADVGTLTHCGRLGDEGRNNTIEITPAPGARLAIPEDGLARRGTLTTSACGVCGRKSIDDLLARCVPVDPRAHMTKHAVLAALESLRATQPVFARTGGCHGAALVDLAGCQVATFEDVGRHNAVDKLVGSRLLIGKIPAPEHALIVSGRTSFEIVQKAIAAGISIVVGISAASSLAVDTARRAGVALVGFVRGSSLVVYSGAERIT